MHLPPELLIKVYDRISHSLRHLDARMRLLHKNGTSVFLITMHHTKIAMGKVALLVRLAPGKAAAALVAKAPELFSRPSRGCTH